MLLRLTLPVLLLACGTPQPPPVSWNGIPLEIGSGVVHIDNAELFSVKYPTLTEESVVHGASGAMQEQLVAAGWTPLFSAPGYHALRLPGGQGGLVTDWTFDDYGMVSVFVLPNPGLEGLDAPLDLSHAVASGDITGGDIRYFARPRTELAAGIDELHTALTAQGWTETERSDGERNGQPYVRIRYTGPEEGAVGRVEFKTEPRSEGFTASIRWRGP